MRRNNLTLAVAGALLVASGAATAATKQTTFLVSTQINPVCNVAAAPLTFTGYDGTATISSSSDITVRCTNLAAYTLRLNAGAGTFAQRVLTNATADTLQYNLFTSAAASTVWGDGTDSTGTISSTGAGLSSGAAKTHTVHGVLVNSTANQDAPSGTYNDLITVTIDY